jgi:hypothetical protein
MTGKARAELAVLLSVSAVPVFRDCGVVLHASMVSVECVLAPVAAFVTAALQELSVLRWPAALTAQPAPAARPCVRPAHHIAHCFAASNSICSVLFLDQDAV